jgi:hypothetical protein
MEENTLHIIKDIRLIDYQSPNLTLAHRSQFCGNNVEMPVERELRLRI